MENGKDKLTSVVTGKVRFSYVNVFEPRSINGGKSRYSMSLIIGKGEVETIAKINSAILYAEREGTVKYGGKVPDNLKYPLRDGDAERPNDDAYRNSYFVNASSFSKPGVVDENLNPITDPGEVYSGCYGRASITFKTFRVDGSWSIACRIMNLQKVCEGEPLCARSTPEEDFTVIDSENWF